MRRFVLLARVLGGTALLAGALCAQELPAGPGREETERLCKQCHEIARVTSLRQDRDGWDSTMAKMKAYGMKATDHDYQVVLDYLASSFAAEAVKKINVNTATAIELESGLTLKRSQSRALIEYRTEHGPFKSLDDLKKVPQVDAAYLDEKKDRIAF